MKKVSVLIVASVVGLGTFTTTAQEKVPPRQFYSIWYKHQKWEYSYRKYFFKPGSGDSAYRFQFVIFKPGKSREWVYWYDPETKEYWARCATKENKIYSQGALSCKSLWSMLPKKERKSVLDQISDKAWEDVQEGAPEIPGSSDNERMDCPPIDLPK